MTTVTGVALDGEALRALAARLKRACGAGGSVKDDVIEIQGDHRDTVTEALRKEGYEVKQAGN